MRSARQAAASKLWSRPFSAIAASVAAIVAVVLLAIVAAPREAAALTPIIVQSEQDRVDITPLGEAYDGRGDSLTVETASSADGVRGRMSVRATVPGTNPRWLVFALTNPTDKPIERWLTADRYTASGSGIVWPDLDARRLEAVTPSIGFVPSRIRSDRADIFALTVEPGQTITYVVELASDRFPRVVLWKPLEYEMKARDRQLFNGVMLGLTVLVAVFLTSIFAANHKVIFPAAALFSWAVFVYLCVEFGFFHKLFNMKPEDNAIYRAASEAAMAASLVIFLHAFLRLRLSHGLVRMLSLIWIAAQLSLVAVAAIDPRLASTFARISFVGIGGIGALVTLYLAVRGQDRALHLVPTWILFLIWIFLAAVTLAGRLPGEAAVSAMMAGLVMVVLLIAFTVTQFAFRAAEPLAGLSTGDSQLRAVAVDGARSAVWEWSSRRDEIKVGSIVEDALGLNPGELNVKVDDFLQHVHSSDRERVRLMLWSVQERAGGKIRADFRMRHVDNTYRWFELEAASVPTSDRRTVRCIGLMRDVTDVKIAHERLISNAVRCSLTGVPNRSLLLDRLGVVLARSATDPAVRPTVMFIDIDKFKAVNATLGLNVGDSVLMTLARRLQRHLGPFDTLARVGGDQFAILFVEEQQPRELAALAERVRRSVRSPIAIANQEVVLTASYGVSIYEGGDLKAEDLLRQAEIAMFRAKRGGADRIEIFKPEMRGDTDDEASIAAIARRAIDRGQLKMLFQPIVYLPTEELAGFEAMVRFEHPKLGLLNPIGVLNSGDDTEYLRKLASMSLSLAIEAVTAWQKELPRPEDHLFVNVDIASGSVLRAELAQEVRHQLAPALIGKGTLRFEISETIVMENPEHAVSILELLRGAGAEIVLDDFGAGFSSLAYLQRLPCDTLKIDRSLMRIGTGSNESGSTVVRAMVALTHEMGRKAIAEGVETPDDVVFLRSIGCEYAQGYYYGEPMGERDVTQLLRIIRKSERKLQTHGFFKTKQRSAKKKRKHDERAETAAANAVVPSAEGQQRAAPVTNGVQHENAATAAEGAVPAAAQSSTLRTRQRPMSPRPSEVPAVAPMSLQPAAVSPPPAPPNSPSVAPGVPPASPHVRTLPLQAAPGPAMPPPMAGPPPRLDTPPTAPPQHTDSAASRPQPLPHEIVQPFPSGAGMAAVPPRPEAVAAPTEPATPPPMPSPTLLERPDRGPPPVPRNAAPPPSPPSPPPSAPMAPTVVENASPQPQRNGRTVNGDGTPHQPPKRLGRVPPAQPDFSTLPPGIAASLAKLAGVPPSAAPRPTDTREKEPTET